jgi:hypothetical protein
MDVWCTPFLGSFAQDKLVAPKLERAEAAKKAHAKQRAAQLTRLGNAGGDVRQVDLADLNVIELYRCDEGGTVGGVYRVGKAEACRIEADAFGILIGENDPAGSGIHHKADTLPIGQGNSGKMTVQAGMENGFAG